jgi:hypothetical protein
LTHRSYFGPAKYIRNFGFVPNYNQHNTPLK